MNRIQVLFVLIISFLVSSCFSTTDKNSSVESNNIDKVNDDTVRNEYAFVKNVYSLSGDNFIEADFVQHLTGNQAIEAAKKNGEADAVIIDGKKKYKLPGDGSYIVNSSNELIKLKLSKNIVFEIINYHNLEVQKNDIFKQFKVRHDGTYILSIKKGEVLKIQEVFIP